MKKAIILLSLFSMLLCGCAKENDAETMVIEEAEIITEAKAEPVPNDNEMYMTTGRYYIKGNVITHDGNVWDYQTEIISDEPAYDNAPVYVVFDDNGTENDIYDDVVVELILDIRTAIYDELEVKLSESFYLERENNNITILGQKGK